MAKNNIPTFAHFVIPMMLLATAVTAETDFKPFVMIGSDILAASSAGAPMHPQLRVSGEIGSFVPLREPLRLSLSLGGMHVEPSIPADAVLYRGYSGAFVSAALAYQANGDGGTEPFLSIGGSCALAHYARTELYFLAYSLHVAPGLASTHGRLELRFSLPLRAEFRGNGTSLSAGLTIAVAKAGRRGAGGKR